MPITNKTNKKNFFHRTDRLNIDLSHRCPLECPHCARQRDFREKGKQIPGEDLSHEDFLKVIEFTTSIHFCGQLSDPIHHPNFIEFLTVCYEKNIDTSIATASSFKPKEWFIEAFKSNPNAKWFFGIDGLPKDSYKYRKNQNGEKLFDIMTVSTTYLKHKPFWQYILFRYNENDVDIALKLAKDNNINFLLINSARYRNADDVLIPTTKKKI